MSNWKNIHDSWGDEIGSTMIDQLMVAESHRISGGVFNGSTPDTSYYVTALAANGTATITNSLLDLATTTDSGSSALLNAQSLGRYIGASMNSYRCIGRLGDTGAVNNTRQWGVANGNGVGVVTNLTDGFFFQLAGTTFSVVARTASSNTVVNSGSFNGDVASFAVDNTFHTYEIFYTNKSIQFYIDKILIHTFTQTTAVICGTRHLKPFSYNYNTGVGSVTHLYTQVLTISRWGTITTQAKSFFQQGTTAGVILKNGPGSIHLMNISGVNNTSNIIIYDGLSAAGTMIYQTGAMTAKDQPFSVPQNSDGGTVFEVGLFLVISGANANCQIKFE